MNENSQTDPLVRARGEILLAGFQYEMEKWMKPVNPRKHPVQQIWTGDGIRSQLKVLGCAYVCFGVRLDKTDSYGEDWEQMYRLIHQTNVNGLEVEWENVLYYNKKRAFARRLAYIGLVDLRNPDGNLLDCWWDSNMDDETLAPLQRGRYANLWSMKYFNDHD